MFGIWRACQGSLISPTLSGFGVEIAQVVAVVFANLAVVLLAAKLRAMDTAFNTVKFRPTAITAGEVSAFENLRLRHNFQ